MNLQTLIETLGNHVSGLLATIGPGAYVTGGEAFSDGRIELDLSHPLADPDLPGVLCQLLITIPGLSWHVGNQKLVAAMPSDGQITGTVTRQGPLFTAPMPRWYA